MEPWVFGIGFGFVSWDGWECWEDLGLGFRGSDFEFGVVFLVVSVGFFP